MSQNTLRSLFKRCWADPELKRRFLAEPAAVLDEEGFIVPEGMKIRVIENTPGEMNIVLPLDPDSLELSSAEMDQVAGGGYLPQRNFHDRPQMRIPPRTTVYSKECYVY